MNNVAIIAVMAVGTMLLRFLPFLIFRKNTPPYISYLGKVLPPALIGMLVIYCIKDIQFMNSPYGVPEMISIVSVAILQLWKHSSLISILGGTVIYMVVAQII